MGTDNKAAVVLPHPGCAGVDCTTCRERAACERFERALASANPAALGKALAVRERRRSGSMPPKPPLVGKG